MTDEDTIRFLISCLKHSLSPPDFAKVGANAVWRKRPLTKSFAIKKKFNERGAYRGEHARGSQQRGRLRQRRRERLLGIRRLRRRRRPGPGGRGSVLRWRSRRRRRSKRRRREEEE
ncbi:hypothetical protein FN846DRAFT_922923, partial [Sphaerosporella brunnea]